MINHAISSYILDNNVTCARAYDFQFSCISVFKSNKSWTKFATIFSPECVRWASAEAGFFKRSLLESTKIHLKTSLRDLAAAM
jgi:hypothetical protein